MSHLFMQAENAARWESEMRNLETSLGIEVKESGCCGGERRVFPTVVWS
jgi:hypothetical protein